MTKIDEAKQYKFSEIIAMMENKELPVGTELKQSSDSDRVVCVSTIWGREIALKESAEYEWNEFWIFPAEINDLWTIKLPKEDKFYLKAPGCFRDVEFLNYSRMDCGYFLSDEYESNIVKTQFTKSEISAMPFDTSFFGEPIKVEDE